MGREGERPSLDAPGALPWAASPPGHPLSGILSHLQHFPSGVPGVQCSALKQWKAQVSGTKIEGITVG